MKTDPIQKYILKSEQNLHIAAAVGEAWPDAREKLVSAFLVRLDVRLKRKLKGWKSERWGGRFFDNAAYYFWKPAWESQYQLCLACREYGQEIIFGVQREKNRLRKRTPSGTVLDAVREVHPSARMTSWWEARIEMRVPAADWRDADVLWQIHKDSKFLDSVAEQLLELAEISGLIVDRLVRKK